MYHITNLEDTVFSQPYKNGYRNLKVLSGYASSAFLTHIVNNYSDLTLELIIGMAGKDGIMGWDHERFKQITRKNKHIQVKYHRALPGVHSKIYHWYKNNEFDNNEAFIGSSNFSWAGFRDQKELIGKVSFSNISDVFQTVDALNCTDSRSEKEIKIHPYEIRTTYDWAEEKEVREVPGTFLTEGNSIKLSELNSIELSLLTSNGKRIHDKAGLNWGQRKGREPNQAYIPVPLTANQEEPYFFPPLENPFTMLTDDGEQFSCTMAQQGRKAIQTTDSNSLLGRYFRKRLNIPFDSKVIIDDLIRYGRNSVKIYKIDNETYFMDFSNKLNNI